MSDDPLSVDILRTPYLRQFAIGRIASVIGAQIVSVTAGWQLYDITHDPWSLGLVGVFELAPVLFLMLPAGNAADRYPRRNVAMFANGLLAFAAAGLAVASHLKLPIAFIYGLLMFIGAARAFASPSVGSIMPQLLRPEQLPRAMAWLSSSYELASITGPAVGGFLIAVTPTLAYGVAALGQIIFIVMLTTLPALPPKHDIQRAPGDVLAGLAFIKRNPLFLSAITLDLFAVLFGGAMALLPVFARDILHVGPMGLGWLRASPSLGALTMALLLTRMKPWERPGRVMLFAVVGFGLSVMAFGLSRNFGLSLACLYVTGLCDEISVVIRSTLQQLITPDYLRGRVASVNYVFVGFSNELGAFESGAMASLFGPVLATVGGGVVSILVVGVVAVLWPQLARVGPLHTLRAVDDELEPRQAGASI